MAGKEKKEKKPGKKQKNEYIEIPGLTGDGIDYGIYHMNMREKITGFVIGFVLGFLMIYIFYAAVPFSLFCGICFGIAARPMYQKYLHEKRRKRLKLQFQDFLAALSAAYSAGQTALGGFVDSYEEMKQTHGPDAEFTKELLIIQQGLASNYRLEDLLSNMADRMHLEVVENFVDTFNVCYSMGGEVKRIVVETRQVIIDQMNIEMEIETGLTENKNSINIIAVMPFIIVTMLRYSGDDTLVNNSLLNVLVKTICLGIFVGSYLWGRKIMNIKF